MTIAIKVKTIDLPYLINLNWPESEVMTASETFREIVWIQ